MIDERLLKNEELAVYKLRALYSSFGYRQYKMSKFEEYDLYARNKDFLVSDRIITFNDTNGKLLALKPDVTLSIINQFGADVNRVQKLYYNENVYRVSGSSKRFREIMQTGLECIGKIGIYEICEVLYLAVKSLEFIDSNYVLDISHAGLILSLLKDVWISEELTEQVIDIIGLKNTGACTELYNEGKINEYQCELISALTENYTDANSFIKAVGKFALSDNSKALFNEFRNIYSSVDPGPGKIVINFSISNDMTYYSGVVFKGYINGIPTGVLSGGQYDKLMQKFYSEGSAVGFAVYLDSFERFKLNTPEYDVDTVLLVSDSMSPADILKKVEELSHDGISVLVKKELPEDIRYRQVIRAEE